MEIWEVRTEEIYKSCILINDDGKQISDSNIYFYKEQKDLSFERKIRFIGGGKIADISYYCGLSGTFVVNDRTKILFESNFNSIQFFPLICENYQKKKFWLLNIFNYQDVLDIAHCKYNTIRNIKGEMSICHIESYAFLDSAYDLDIFKIIVNGVKRFNTLFVTDKFKKIIEENNITGLNLKKVYEI